MTQLKTQNSKLKTKIFWFLKGLVLVFCLWLVFILAGRVLRQIAITQIEELTNTKVDAKSIKFKLNGSVFAEGLVIGSEGKRKFDDAILKAETVYARFGVGSLLLLRPRLKEINIDGFVFNAQCDLDAGRWNIEEVKINIPKGGAGELPIIHLERGTLQYSKVSKGQIKVIAAVPLDVKLEPARKLQDGYSFDITTARRDKFERSILSGFWRPGRIIVTGGISSTDIPAFERVWRINVLAAELNYDRNKTYSLKLKIKDLYGKHSPADEIFAFDTPPALKTWNSFAALQKFFSRYHPAGLCGIELEASGNLDRLSESKLLGKIDCKDASICYFKFPYPIEHITGQIDFTEESIHLNNLCGQHNDVKLFFNGWTRDFGPNWKYQVRITSDNMVLDNDLYSALNTKQQKFWSAFSPSGLAAIDYRISRQSQTDKKKTLAVKPLGAEAVYRGFPYPLKNLTGTLLFERYGMTISDVVSQYNERKITLNGKATSVNTERPIYEVSIKADNVPLDSTLEAALPAVQKRFYNLFCLDGLADADIKIFTPKQDLSPTSFTADIFFKNTSLKVPISPKESEAESPKENQTVMAITDISANAVLTPALIDIRNLTGHCSQGLVSLTGRIWPGWQTDEQLRYHLALQLEQVQLNEDLFSLLPGMSEEIFSKLQPKGKINLIADLNKAGSDDRPDYMITVDCLGNSVNFELFPYPLKDITGTLIITTDSIKLKDIIAMAADNVQITPGASTIKTNGLITLADNGFSSGQFQIDASDIFFDERLGIALPGSIQSYYSKLSPTGRFDMNDINVKIFNAANDEKHIDFAGDIKFKDCSFKTSPAITELNATLKTKGLYKTGDGFCNGGAILLADNIRIKGKSLTGLKADINYDPQQQNWLTKNLIADCYGGKLAGKFELKQSVETTPEYLLQAGFYNIDLEQFLRDTKSGEISHNGYTKGKMNGSLSVSGQIGDGYSRIGRCRVQIADMQIGKLSPLAKLLYILKLTEPKDFAFDQMLVDSYIKHNKLFFQQLDLSGEALAFNGSGWMDLQNQDIDLTLTARGRRLATAGPSILQSLTESLGQGVVRMEVSGNIYDPQITTKTLPVIKETLQILGTKQIRAD